MALLSRFQGLLLSKFDLYPSKDLLPIEPVTIALPDSNPVVIRANSALAKRYWWLAGYIKQVVQQDSFTPQVYWRKVPLGVSYFQLPDFGACNIVFTPALWFEVMSVEVLQSDTPAAPLIPLPLPTPLPVPIPLPPYLP